MLNLDQILYSLRWPLTHFWVNIRHTTGYVVQYFFFITTSEKHLITIAYLKRHVLKFPKLCAAIDLI